MKCRVFSQERRHGLRPRVGAGRPRVLRIVGTGISTAAIVLCLTPISALQATGAPPRAGQTGRALVTPADHFTSISSGGSTTCGIQTGSGMVVCWGGDQDGTAESPKGAFGEVAQGGGQGCAIKAPPGSAGPVVCWGVDTMVVHGRFKQISDAGSLCGIKAGGQAIICWWDEGGRLQIRQRLGSFVQVSASPWFLGGACGVGRVDGVAGSLRCWGDSAAFDAHVPTGHFLQVSVGGYVGQFACALRTNRTVVCWGNDSNGQTKPPGGPFTQVSSGGETACGLRPNGAAVCWGGQPTAPTGRFIQVTTGDFFACGLRVDATPICWGNNDVGETEVPAAGFEQISLGGNWSACGIRAGGSLTCWGALGNTPLPAGLFTHVSLGYYDEDWACGLRVNGTVACWSDYPALFGETSPPPGTFTRLSAGGDAACAVRTDGSLACWGDMVGFGPIPSGGFIDVAVGGGAEGNFVCAIRVTGHLVCWGDPTGYNYQPDGQIRPPSGIFTKVVAGQFGACALARSGRMACWGGFVNAAPSGKFTQMSVGGGDFGMSAYVCGLRTSGAAVCGGSHSVDPGPYRGIAVATGGYVCLISSDGSVGCIGNLPVAG